MNKADKIFIGLIVVISCLLYVPSLWYAYQNQGSVKEVVVSYKDKVVLQKRLSLDHVYEVKGTLGPVKVEVNDEKVRVEKETSPYHLCSIQGWVDDVNRPIVCLPNNIVVEIRSASDKEADIDTVIQ